MPMHDGMQEENTCWMDPPYQDCCKPRYKSQFAAKVKWEVWLAKNGCCRTIGPPPKVCYSCPEHFLKKHSRQVPVFLPPEVLRTPKQPPIFNEANEPIIPRQRVASLDTGLSTWRVGKKSRDCPYYKPPSRMGLFRGPTEPSYEQKYRINKPRDCPCDEQMFNEFLEATKCAGVMAAEREKQARRYASQQPVKDFLRANAINVIRMPARRTKRCYIDKCGIHLLDMSDSPYVLRPGFGKVPSYICRRKQELLQEDMEYKRRLQQVACSNFEAVDDAEKEMVIQGLKDCWSNLNEQYSCLSLNDPNNERNRELKADLESRMDECEADLRLLTRSNSLFVEDVQESCYL